MRQNFIAKYVRLLTTKNASFIENLTVITKCFNFITYCDIYCKMPSLLQNSSAEILIDFKKTYELVIQLVTLPLQSALPF